MNMHVIGAEDAMRTLGAASKTNASMDFLLHLKKLGQTTADQWLKKNWDTIGEKSSIDLRKSVSVDYLSTKSRSRPKVSGNRHSAKPANAKHRQPDDQNAWQITNARVSELRNQSQVNDNRSAHEIRGGRRRRRAQIGAEHLGSYRHETSPTIAQTADQHDQSI